MGNKAKTSVKALIYIYNLYEPIRLPQNHSDLLVLSCAICTVQYRGAQIFKHLRSHLKILGSRIVASSNLTQDSLILGAIVQN